MTKVRKNWKRVSAAPAVLLALTAALSACGGGSQASQPAANGSAAGNAPAGDKKQESKTITFWYGVTGPSEDALKQMVKDFEAKNPNIKVNMTYVANMMAGGGEKLLAAISGGTPPDVTYFDRFQVGSWAAQGALTDLSDRIKSSGIKPEMYYKFAWDESTFKGKQYALPTSTDARMLYYNKDQFKEVGLDPEHPPKTIQELEDAAAKLTIKKGNKFERIGFIPWLDQGWLYTWGWVFGGSYYDEKSGKVTANDPKIVAALQWLSDYGKKYNVADITSFTDSAGQAQMSPFVSGQLSMQVSGNSMMAQIKKYKPDLNYGVAPIPTPTGSNFTTWSGGWSLVIPKGAKQPDAAFELVKYAAGDGQEVLNKLAGDLSVIPEVNVKLGYDKDPNYKAFLDVLPQSHNRPVITQGQLLWNEFKSALDLGLHGKGTPQEILDNVTNKVNAELAKDAAK